MSRHPSPTTSGPSGRARWSLQDKVVLVTGAAGGIGEATIQALVGRGAIVAAADIDADATRRLTDDLGGLGTAHPLDVTNVDACAGVVADVIAAHGRIDVVWANAGISAYGPLDLVDPAIWTRVVQVNLLGAHHLLHAALPHVIESQGYVAVTCSLASFAHQPGHTAYSASKAGLEAMANSLRSELTGTGVDVGSFHPGWIATKMVTEKDEHQAAFRRFRQALRPPFDRSVEVETIVPHIVDAFERRQARMVFPRAGWLAHAVRPIVNTAALTSGVRAAAPEIRALFAQQMAAEGTGAAMSERYRDQLAPETNER